MKHHTFLAAANAADLPAQVRLAREAACKMILQTGVDSMDSLSIVDELAGGPFEANLTIPAGDIWTDYCHHINAAFALGIVVGQLVHPDVFKGRGPR